MFVMGLVIIIYLYPVGEVVFSHYEPANILPVIEGSNFTSQWFSCPDYASFLIVCRGILKQIANFFKNNYKYFSLLGT